MAEYTTDRRRAARLLLTPERRQEIGRLGGLKRMAEASAAEKTAMALAGAASRMVKQSPEHRREIAQIGARALRARRTEQELHAWTKRGGYPSHLIWCQRCEATVRKGDLLDGEACPRCRLVL